MISLDNLEKLANEASKGEWVADDFIVFCEGESVAMECRRSDASFIASASPETILQLIYAIRNAIALSKEAMPWGYHGGELDCATNRACLRAAIQTFEMSLKEIE